MNNIYIVLLSLLVDANGQAAATAPRTRQHHWLGIPNSTPARVILVAHFADETARIAFEALPGVFAFSDVMLTTAIPPAAVTALAPLGAQTGDTVFTFLQRLRASWPGARPWFD